VGPSYSWRCLYWRGARNRHGSWSSYDSGYANSGRRRWSPYHLNRLLNWIYRPAGSRRSPLAETGVKDDSEGTRGYFISRARLLLIVFLILGVIVGPEMLEPKDVVECEPVTVMSYHQGLRSQRFTVAIGRWTGGEHWRLYASCPGSDA
jgi:hypothetical protein